VPLRLVYNRSPDMLLPLSPDHDEHALLQRIVQGDAQAFERFYTLYYPRLFRFILRVTRQADLIEELIQETLLLVWEQPQRFNGQSKISTWVLGIAYRKSLKAMAKSARQHHDVDWLELSETTGDPLENLAIRIETSDWLHRALASLSAEQRAVIELTFYHGLSYLEIAKILDCPENTVKTRMYHARKKLQALADSEG